MLTSLPLLVCIGAGLIGGVFFAFSSFVMKALAELPAAHGIDAMQRINVVVLIRSSSVCSSAPRCCRPCASSPHQHLHADL